MIDAKEFVSSAEVLRRAFDHMVQEARCELHEHEQHVVDAKARLQHLTKLRTALDVVAIPEQQQ